jgi:O-antigen/teichoic acid export membrane protein
MTLLKERIKKIEFNQLFFNFRMSRLRRDVIWNIASLFVLAICGILTNFAIGKYYGPEALGIFNQVFAVLIICSQLSSCGLYFSCINFIAENQQDAFRYSNILITALALSLIIACFVCLTVLLGRNLIFLYFDSKNVELGTLLILPAVLFSGLNRILLAALNGLRHMRIFALFQSLRYLLIFFSVLILISIGLPSFSLATAFSIAEIILFCLILGYIIRFTWITFCFPSREWFLKHIKFAGKAFPSGFLLDVNMRIDVMILGLLFPDKTVGIYSIAAMLAEGVAQVPYAILYNVNPLIVKYRLRNEFSKIKDLIRKVNLTTVPILTIISISCVILFRFTIKVFGMSEFFIGWQYLTILLTGISLSSGFIPFGMILNQFGYPGWQTIYLSSIVLTNLILNSFLIPMYGNIGAASATAISFFLSIFYLKFFFRKATSIKIL